MLTFHVFWLDLINGIRTEKFNEAERDKILSFLDRAFVRLDAWFQWFNTSQKGNNMETIFTELLQDDFTFQPLCVWCF